MLLLLQEALEYIEEQHRLLKESNIINFPASQRRYKIIHGKILENIVFLLYKRKSEINIKQELNDNEFIHAKTCGINSEDVNKIESNTLCTNNTSGSTPSEDSRMAMKPQLSDEVYFKMKRNEVQPFSPAASKKSPGVTNGKLGNTNKEHLHLTNELQSQDHYSTTFGGIQSKNVAHNISTRPLARQDSEKEFPTDVNLKKNTNSSPMTSKKSNLLFHIQKIHSRKSTFKCDKCQQEFPTNFNLQKHMAIHIIEKPFKCHLCGKGYVVNQALQRHMVLHTHNSIKKKFKCEICNKVYSRKGLLEKHKSTHTDNKPYKCNVCRRRFCGKQNFKSHMSTHRGEKTFKCEICDKRYLHAVSLRKHMLAHARGKSFKCDICGKEFTQSGRLQTHIVLSHTAVDTVNISKGDFEQNKDLEQHSLAVVKTSTSNETNNSKIFQKNTFNYKISDIALPVNLLSPIEESTKQQTPTFKIKIVEKQSLQSEPMQTLTPGQQLFKCMMCKKGFDQVKLLQAHIIHTHRTSHRSLKCEICNKEFFNEKFLKMHMLEHKEQNVPKAKADKNEVLRKQNLWARKQRHVMTHSSLSCHVCRKTFLKRRELTKHFQIHFKEQRCPFKCEICVERFSEKSLLDKHMLIHTGSGNHYPFKCNLCKKGYHQKDELQQHLFDHLSEIA